jgi:hypothetical protein
VRCPWDAVGRAIRQPLHSRSRTAPTRQARVLRSTDGLPAQDTSPVRVIVARTSCFSAGRVISSAWAPRPSVSLSTSRRRFVHSTQRESGRELSCPRLGFTPARTDPRRGSSPRGATIATGQGLLFAVRSPPDLARCRHLTKNTRWKCCKGTRSRPTVRRHECRAAMTRTSSIALRRSPRRRRRRP